MATPTERSVLRALASVPNGVALDSLTGITELSPDDLDRVLATLKDAGLIRVGPGLASAKPVPDYWPPAAALTPKGRARFSQR